MASIIALLSGRLDFAQVVRAERQLHALEAERDELKARLATQDATVWNLQQDLAKASEPTPPANIADVAHHLAAVLPSAPAASGFAVLQKAHDARSLAQAIHLLMLDARLVGFQEAKR